MKYIFENEVFLQLGSVPNSVHPYETVGLFINIGRLELFYRVQTFWDYSLSS